MSASEFYLNKGFTSQFRFSSRDAVGTFAIWTPTTSMRAVITNLNISSNLGGTIALYWSFSSGGKQVGEFFVAGSSTIIPLLGVLEGTMVDGTLWGNVSQSGTNGWKITAYGFEM